MALTNHPKAKVLSRPETILHWAQTMAQRAKRA
jgi:hypothetical protein